MSYFIAKHSFVPEITFKVVLDLSNYAAIKELDHGTGVDTSDLAAKQRFFCFEIWSWKTRHY